MAALIVGIIAVIGILIPIAGIVLGIVAVVLGASGRGDLAPGEPGYGQSKAAVILGVVAITGAIMVWIVTVIAVT